jgi:hypothetical protein
MCLPGRPYGGVLDLTMNIDFGCNIPGLENEGAAAPFL